VQAEIFHEITLSDDRINEKFMFHEAEAGETFLPELLIQKCNIA